MSEAVDNLHAIERLVALAGAGPGADANALREARVILTKMGFENGASGYKAEKLKVVSDGFDQLFSGEPTGHLARDIDHLRKALARGAEGQD
jgi:hypothetical protein